MSIRETVNPSCPGWLDIWESSDYLNIPESTLRKWIRDGLLPVAKPGGKPKSHMRIWSEDLDLLMRQSYRPAVNGPLANGNGGGTARAYSD
jgi:excisionase family DNA binding protein